MLSRRFVQVDEGQLLPEAAMEVGQHWNCWVRQSNLQPRARQRRMKQQLSLQDRRPMSQRAKGLQGIIS